MPSIFCLLPNTTIKSFHEVLQHCHPISWHQSVHQIRHGHARLLNCIREIDVPCSWRIPTRRMCSKTRRFSLLWWRHSARAHLQLHGHAYWKLLTDATGDCLHLRLSSAPSLLLSWVTSCPPLESVKGLSSFIDANKALSRVFPTAPNLSIHLNLPWSSYNLMTCFSGMKTFAKDLLLLSFLVLLINFGLSPMLPWPREVLEPPCLSLDKTTCSSKASTVQN